MWPCGTELPLQFGQPVHARISYANYPSIDTFIYLQCLNLDGDIDEGDLRQVIEQMKKDAKVTAEVPVDRVVDLSVLREVRAELEKKKP
jgi:hypothetical protein